MSVLLDYINEHEDWEQLLSEAPYNIKVSTDGVYRLLKYNQLNSDFNEPIVRECRGCIVKRDVEGGRWVFMAHAMDKFFNYGEPQAAVLDWNTATVMEKIDGSLIKMWHDKDWHISTNGTIDAFKAPTGNALYPTYGALVLQALEDQFGEYHENFFAKLDCNCVYWFELVSPYAQVVIPYENTKLYFLGWRDRYDDKELDYKDCVLFHEMITPREHNLFTLEDVVNSASFLAWDEEGYVVKDAHFNRVKIKSPEYVKAHYLRNNNVVTDERLLDVLLAHEEDEFLAYCSDYKDRIKELDDMMYCAALNAYCSLENVLRRWIDKDEDDRRSFALIVNEFVEPEYRPFLFAWYRAYKKGEKFGWYDHTAGWTAAKWKKFLAL